LREEALLFLKKKKQKNFIRAGGWGAGLQVVTRSFACAAGIDPSGSAPFGLVRGIDGFARPLG
jgi:hypothetical protein